MKRQSISTKTRFEIFKRDRFACQYCGATPPAVVLHVDHIVAVANGGENNSDNLITSCEKCNQGKGAKELSTVPQSLREKAIETAEREAQLVGYQEILQARRKRIEGESWQIAEVLCPGCTDSGINNRWFSSIKQFTERLGLYEVLEAAEIAVNKYPRSGRRTFLYFCGVCWKKVREQNHGEIAQY